jgi:ribonuclease Z
MMLDCGEGSLGQLYRYAGGDQTRLQQLVDRLKCIWVSHNHADHHLGILRMLSCRSTAHCSNSDREGKSVEPLLIIGPPHVEFWLREYARLDPTVAGKYTFVDSYLFNDADERFEDDFSIGKPARTMLREMLGVEALDCVPVKHAHLSYALVATFVGGAKIAFSGDCRPSDAFARKARGALLMVHEATFEESMTTEAKQKAHCTTTEAIDVATRAQAKHVVLTHFSQRYPKMPVMASAAAGGEDTPDVLTAIDLLSLDLRALRQPALSDICSQLMSKDDEEDEDADEKLEEDEKSNK